MRRHDRPDEMGFFDDDRDSAIAELLRRAYARKVDVDTAARHLWAIDVAARAGREAARPRRSRRTVVAMLTSLMLMATSGVAVASVAAGGTLPGDALYSLKRGTERARLVLAVRPETDAQVHLSIAQRRWNEAQQAAQARPTVVPRLLKDTFEALQAAERGGGPAAEQALALRTEVSASSAELAFGPHGQTGTPKPQADDGASEAATEPPPSAPAETDDADDTDTDTDADDIDDTDAGEVDAGEVDAGDDDQAQVAAAPPLAAGSPPETAPPAPTEPPAPVRTPDAPPPADAPSPGTAAPPPVVDTPPAESEGAPQDQPPAPTDGDGAGQPDGESQSPPGEGAPPPAAPTQPVPATTGEPVASEPPPEPPSAPGWGRPRP